MKLSDLNSADLKRAMGLLDRKAKLVAELDEIETQLAAIEGGKPGRRVAGAGRPGGRAKRGAIKDAVIAALKAAGPSGIMVKDIAAKTHVNGQKISTWFVTTGKRIKEVQKMGRGRFRWNEGK